MAQHDITQEAKEDLYKIWAYTVDTWSEEQADKYYALLEAGMNEVADAVQRLGMPCDEIYPSLQTFHVHRHMLFYTILANGRGLIVRILHERMDYARHFNP